MQYGTINSSRFYTSCPKPHLFCNWKFIPFDPLHPFYLPTTTLASGSHQCILCTLSLFCFNFSFFLKVSHVSETTWFLSLFHLVQCCQGPSMLLQMTKILFFLWVNNISYIPHFLYQFIHQWTLGCLHILAIINSVTVNMGVHVSF